MTEGKSLIPIGWEHVYDPDFSPARRRTFDQLTEIMANMKVSPDVSVVRIARENGLWNAPDFAERICARMQQVADERNKALRETLAAEGKCQTKDEQLLSEVITVDDVERALCWECSLM